MSVKLWSSSDINASLSRLNDQLSDHTDWLYNENDLRVGTFVFIPDATPLDSFHGKICVNVNQDSTTNTIATPAASTTNIANRVDSHANSNGHPNGTSNAQNACIASTSNSVTHKRAVGVVRSKSQPIMKPQKFKFLRWRTCKPDESPLMLSPTASPSSPTQCEFAFPPLLKPQQTTALLSSSPSSSSSSSSSASPLILCSSSVSSEESTPLTHKVTTSNSAVETLSGQSYKSQGSSSANEPAAALSSDLLNRILRWKRSRTQQSSMSAKTSSDGNVCNNNLGNSNPNNSNHSNINHSNSNLCNNNPSNGNFNNNNNNPSNKHLIPHGIDANIAFETTLRSNLVKKPIRSIAYRYPVLMNIKTRSVDAAKIQRMSTERVSLLPKLWFSEPSLLRILYGAKLRCDCDCYHHKDAENHVMLEKRLFDEHRNRVTMLDLFGVEQFHTLLVEARKQNISYVQHDHMFLDEYAAVSQTFVAMRLCCNSRRFDQCLQFSRWLFQTIQKTKETYRSRIFLERETQLRQQTTDNQRIIASLEAQLLMSEKRVAHVQQMYETALRCLRPNKSANTNFATDSPCNPAASAATYISMCSATSDTFKNHSYTNTTKPII